MESTSQAHIMYSDAFYENLSETPPGPEETSFKRLE